MTSKDSDGAFAEGEAPQLVVVFQAGLSQSKKSPSTQLEGLQAAATEYERLLHALEAVGLNVASREGELRKGQVFVYVRCSARALAAAAAAEKMNDYLHGVSSSAEIQLNMSRTSSLPAGSGNAVPDLTVADQLRLTHALITNPVCDDKTKVWHTVSGAGISVKSEKFPHVTEIIALHDDAYNSQWLKKWTTLSSAFKINTPELNSVRSHFGEEVALYFGFLVFYFNALLPLASAGFLFWAWGKPYDHIYSTLLVGWACLTVEAWRMRERKLSVLWGSHGVTSVDAERHDFQPRRIQRDPVTGEQQPVFEWWRREARIALSLPVMLFYAALLGVVLTSMFVIEVFIAKMYTGPGRSLVPLAPTALFTTAVPQILAAWQATASWLTKFENHRTRRTHQASLTLKMFALQAVVAYGALTLSAFVYIPFGQHLMDEMVSRGYLAEHVTRAIEHGDLKYDTNGKIHFDVNPTRMQTQLFAVSVTSQAVNAFTELFLPIILRHLNRWRAERTAKKSTGGTFTGPKRTKLIIRTIEQLALPNYDTFTDYAEMATQFGYIVLWSTIWPLSPLVAFVNNFFEIRSDAAKICLNARRPIPARTETVGPWLDVLGFIAWSAAMLNAALLFLFDSEPISNSSGRSSYQTVLRQHASPAIRNSTVALEQRHFKMNLLSASGYSSNGTVNTLFASLLIAIASEHGYVLVRSLIRHILERASWRGSSEAQALMRRNWQSRRTLLQMLGENQSHGPTSASEKPISAFWAEQLPSSAIVSMGKSE